MRRPQLQRLVAVGRGAVPNIVVVDVGALVRWERDEALNEPVLAKTVEAARRSIRTFTWVVAPTGAGAVEGAELVTAESILRDAGVDSGDVLRTLEPAASLVGRLGGTSTITFVSANMEEWWYELEVLTRAAVVLDIATGRAWSAVAVGEAFGEPRLLASLWSAAPADGSRPLVKEAKQYREEIREALAAGKLWREAKVPPRVREALARVEPQLKELTVSVRTGGGSDEKIANELRRRVEPGVLFQAGRAPTEVRVVADVERSEGAYRLRRVAFELAGVVREAITEEDSLRLLADIPSSCTRWVTAGGMDLLAAMVDAGQVLPRAVVDTAMLACTSNPDAPYDPAWISRWGAGLTAEQRDWLRDVDRVKRAPADIHSIAQVLRPLVDDWMEYVEAPMVERDLAETLPVLGELERQGAWVDRPEGFESFAAYGDALEQEVRDLLRTSGKLFGKEDPSRASSGMILAVAKHYGSWLPPDEFDPGLEPLQHLDRLAARGDEHVKAALRVRSIVLGTLPWVRRLAVRDRIRGRQFVERSGRIGFREFNLQGMPKHDENGRRICSGLRGPPGLVLVGADYNAFEARLLAALSGDNILLEAASREDMHRYMAFELFGENDDHHRAVAKASLYAIVYGQGRDAFWMSHSDFTRADALRAFDLVEQKLKGAMGYRDKVLESFADLGHVHTEGGWYRSPPRRTQAFNLTIQGLSADILRWVLRALKPRLQEIGGFLVHQSHDEVLAAVPPGTEDRACEILRSVMEDGVRRDSELLQCDVPFFLKPKVGKSWSDFL